MKKLILIVALTAMAFGVNAQTISKTEIANDSISVMFRSLQNTNKELVYINDNLRLHSQIALGSIAMVGVSAFSFYRSSIAEATGTTTYHNGPNGSWAETPTDYRKVWRTVGITTGIIGAVGFVCSYIPIWTSKVHLDQRGLVIDLP